MQLQTFAITFLLASCAPLANPPAGSAAAPVEKREIAESDFAEIGLSRDAAAVLDAHFQAQFGGRAEERQEGCVRGEPRPWMKSAGLPEGAYAYRKAGPAAAIETLVRSDGGSITIFDWGCEYYVASVRYVFPRRGPADSIEALLGRIAEALRELQHRGAQSGFGLAQIEAELGRREDLTELLRSGDELPIPGDGEDFLQTRLVIRRAGTLPGGTAGFVEFRLVKGPL